MSFPKQIISGDTNSFTFPEAEFTSADGWVMKVQIVADETEIKVSGDYSAGQYSFSVSAGQSSKLKAGKSYRFTQYVEKGSGDSLERHSLYSQMIPVIVGLITDLEESRSLASKILEKIEAVLEGSASTDVKRYEIRGRSLERMDKSELIKWRKYWQKELRIEEAAASGKSIGPRSYRMTLR